MNEEIDSDKLYAKTGITLPHGSLFHNFVNPMGAPEEDKDKEIKTTDSKPSENLKEKRRIVYSIKIKK